MPAMTVSESPTLRYETVRAVSGGCGSAGIPEGSGTVAFRFGG